MPYVGQTQETNGHVFGLRLGRIEANRSLVVDGN